MPYSLSRGTKRFSLNDNAVGTVFDPAQVFSNTLWMWWRADDLPYSHSQQIASWQGYTGNPQTSQSAYIWAQATARLRPTYRTSSFGTMPGAYFQSSLMQYLGLPALSNVLGSSGYYWTIVFVGRWLSGASNQTVLSNGTGDARQPLRIDNSSSIYTYDSSDSNNVGLIAPYYGVTKMITITKNDSSYATYYDGTTQIFRYSGTTNAFQRMGYLGIYNPNYGVQYAYNGWMGEIMVLNQGITFTDVKNLHDNYYKIKYASDTTFV